MSRKIRRSYKGASQEAVLDSSGVTSSTQTSIALSTSPSTWPTGKFFVVVAPGTAEEEKMCVALSGATLTVVDPGVVSNSASVNGRGVDNTTARTTIAGGAVVYPVFTAVDADEANELTSAYTTRGDIVYQGASTFARLGVGTANQVLRTNGTDPSWGQVVEGGISDGAVTESKIANSAVTSAKIADGTIVAGDLASNSVTTVKITDANVTTNKINDLAVTTEKINNSAVTTVKIADTNVTNAKIDYTTVPQTTVSTVDPTGGKNGDIWVKVI